MRFNSNAITMIHQRKFVTLLASIGVCMQSILSYALNRAPRLIFGALTHKFSLVVNRVEKLYNWALERFLIVSIVIEIWRDCSSHYSMSEMSLILATVFLSAIGFLVLVNSPEVSDKAIDLNIEKNLKLLEGEESSLLEEK